MTGGYRATANQRSGRAIAVGQPRIFFESTTSQLAYVGSIEPDRVQARITDKFKRVITLGFWIDKKIC